jgi:hypothetical protein
LALGGGVLVLGLDDRTRPERDLNVAAGGALSSVLQVGRWFRLVALRLIAERLDLSDSYAELHFIK